MDPWRDGLAVVGVVFSALGLWYAVRQARTARPRPGSDAALRLAAAAVGSELLGLIAKIAAAGTDLDADRAGMAGAWVDEAASLCVQLRRLAWPDAELVRALAESGDLAATAAAKHAGPGSDRAFSTFAAATHRLHFPLALAAAHLMLPNAGGD